jgi:hypothetical protein
MIEIENRKTLPTWQPALVALALSVVASACASEVDGEGADADESEAVDVQSISQSVVRTPITFGTRCQADYQNDWQANWNNYPACAGFNNKLDDTDSKRFYFNLHGALSVFQDANGSDASLAAGGPDSVDLMLFNAHGGTDATRWLTSMWDQGALLFSDTVRMGDDGVGLSVFAMYSCNTMAVDTIQRMRPMFRGGLRIAAGAHGLVWNGNHSWGNNFASAMQADDDIKDSWLNAVEGADSRNNPAVWASGANRDDCYSRIGATLANVKSKPRLRDNQVAYYCYFWI